MKEIWKDIVGYSGYKISNHGRVCSKKLSSRYKIIKPFINIGGYLCIGLRVNGKRKGMLIHRLVALHFIENPENKPCVAHLDGTRNNTHVSNLMWATHKENSSHTIIHGTRLKMTGRPESEKPTKDKKISARLTEEDYMKIKSVYGSLQKFLDLMVKAVPIIVFNEL